MSEDQNQSRRKFLKLGAALMSATAIAGCGPGNGPSPSNGTTKTPDDLHLDFQTAIKLVGKDLQGFRMPGNAELPGPGGDRDWPDKSKYAGVKKVPGMCQLCSTVCGIIGYVKTIESSRSKAIRMIPTAAGIVCPRPSGLESSVPSRTIAVSIETGRQTG